MWTLLLHLTLAAEPASQLQIRCQTFEAPGDQLDTSDLTTRPGQWVKEQHDLGWTLRDVQFSMSQKRNGYPQAVYSICMARTQAERTDSEGEP